MQEFATHSLRRKMARSQAERDPAYYRKSPAAGVVFSAAPAGAPPDSDTHSPCVLGVTFSPRWKLITGGNASILLASTRRRTAFGPFLLGNARYCCRNSSTSSKN